MTQTPTGLGLIIHLTQRFRAGLSCFAPFGAGSRLLRSTATNRYEVATQSLKAVPFKEPDLIRVSLRRLGKGQRSGGSEAEEVCEKLCRPLKGTRVYFPLYPALRLRLRAGLN